ncbi:hypothetical protein BH23ACT3_BH23ACT3_01560 [soil metagenome]
MFFWFIGTSVLAIWYVFRDPRFDYRLLIVGSVLPPAVDVWFGGARVMHSLTLSVALMTIVMLVTTGRRPIRRTLLGLPLGTLLHLVFTGAWTDTTVFWWPFSGGGFGDAPLPIAERGWWNVMLEIIGVVLVLRIWRQAGLSSPDARSLFRTTGQLGFPARPPG